MNANAPHNAIDNNIDRALSALRDAAPRPGLEGRILTSLEHRAIASQPARFHLSAHIAIWAATAAAIVAIASLLLLHHRAAPTEMAHAPQSSDGVAAGFSPRNLRAVSAGALAPAHLTHKRSSRPEHAARSGETCISDHPQIGCPIHDDNTVRRGTTTSTDPDAQALADLHAPSHPAPPLPLTAQEKLFLNVLRYGNATQLAELNPVVRAQQDAEETAAFKAFFPDPPPLQQPLGDTE